jgi:aconitate hydratase 2/2-methylisocitrate dehydratase
MKKNAVRNENGDVVLEAYSVATGLFFINTKTKVYNGDKELIDISKAFTQKMEFIKAGGSYASIR